MQTFAMFALTVIADVRLKKFILARCHHYIHCADVCMFEGIILEPGNCSLLKLNVFTK